MDGLWDCEIKNVLQGFGFRHALVTGVLAVEWFDGGWVGEGGGKR